MFRRKGKGVKTLKMLRTQKKKRVLIADTTQGKHLLGLYFLSKLLSFIFL